MLLVFFVVELLAQELIIEHLLLLGFGMRIELCRTLLIYIKMSPFMAANKIKKPILLIHGEEDNNSGMLTMQSDRFFNALKGYGALSRLVLLPFESHGYSSRESIMHVLWETDRWLQIFLFPTQTQKILCQK